LFYYAWTPIPSPDNYTGRFPWSQVSDRKWIFCFNLLRVIKLKAAWSHTEAGGCYSTFPLQNCLEGPQMNYCNFEGESSTNHRRCLFCCSFSNIIHKAQEW
jgi:hypothetical protein